MASAATFKDVSSEFETSVFDTGPVPPWEIVHLTWFDFHMGRKQKK